MKAEDRYLPHPHTSSGTYRYKKVSPYIQSVPGGKRPVPANLSSPARLYTVEVEKELVAGTLSGLASVVADKKIDELVLDVENNSVSLDLPNGLL